MAEYRSKVLIIGSGPAGYTAGIYIARAGLKPILVSGQQSGGQLTLTTEVENFPGFPTPILGGDLMNNMRQQALNVGVEIIDDVINEVDFSQSPFICNSENYNLYSADAVIICTGASAKWLGLPSEKKYLGFGVSACATCDGYFYKNKDVAVVGGGNTAVEEAIYLTSFARSVTLIHRRDMLRADKSLQEKLFKNRKITIEWDSIIEEITGDEQPLNMTGLKIKNIKTDSKKTLNVDGLFIAIGHTPNTSLFKGQIDLDKDGYIITHNNSTNIKGIFAAGDVQDPQYRQAIVAAGSGCKAALEVEKYLLEK